MACYAISRQGSRVPCRVHKICLRSTARFYSFLAPSQATKEMAVFILEDALSVWTNLGKHLLFVWLFVSSKKTGIRLDGLSSVVRLERRTTENSLSRRIMRLLV